MWSSKIDLQTKQTAFNIKLGKTLAKQGISKLRLINVGNSIASGYSTTRTTKPLFLRNESLQEDLDHYGVSLDYHSFARPQNNCDEHILEWFINNSSESDIDSLVRHDYLAEETGMHPIGITKDEIDEYYPENNQKNDGLLDLSKESDDSMANVIVYNGCTGSFLDNNFKKGFMLNNIKIKKDIIKTQNKQMLGQI